MFLINTVIIFIVATASAVNTTKVPQVDHVIDSLSRQQWDEDEAICRMKIFSLLNNVKNSTLWATWVWDSNAKAPYGTFYGARFHLGSYDQCLRAPWLPAHPELRTQYCLADIEMKDPGAKSWHPPGPFARAEEYYVDGGTPLGRNFSFLSYGVCLPAACQTKSVTKYAKALLSGQHLQAAWDADLKVHSCEEAGAPRVVPRGYYVFTYTFAALISIALASTYYISEYSEKAKSNTLVNHVARSFCLRRNWESVFKEDKDALPCLDGIRFLTTFLVVFCHTGVYTARASVANGIDLEKKMEGFTISALFLTHADLLVDTFFAMSALLLGRSLATMDITKPYNLLKYILKRYIRLFGAYAVIIFYVAYVMLQKDNGPLYTKLLQSEQQACESNWWVSLLMLGNYVNIDTMCITATWYIPCDFHLYAATVILLYVYRRNPKVGSAVASTVVFLGLLSPPITTYLYDLPAITALNMGVGSDLRAQINFKKGYLHTHIRMGPYLAGLLVGYLMSVHKPADYKKKLSKTASFLGACAGLGLMMTMLAAGVLCYQYRVYGLLASLFRAFDRIVFASGVLCIIISCTYGDVPLINSLLSWSPFRSLSRFTYGLYLIHSPLMLSSKLGARSHLRYHMPDAFVETCGSVVMGLMLSLAVFLLVEAPLVNITNKYLDTKSELKKAGNMNGKETSQNEGVEYASDKPKLI